MTEFGKWLGESNGKEMLAAVFTHSTKEQQRSALTTYCIIFGINVDTFEWDALIDYVYENYNNWADSKEEFDDYMCELLV